MKTRNIFTAIVAMVITINLLASETPQFSIIPLENAKALVTVAQSVPAVNEVSITSEAGDIVYYKRSNNAEDNYRKIFDLSRLENGNYDITLKAGKITHARELEVKNGKVLVKEESTEMEPYFSFEGNQVNVSYLNYDKKNVKLNVYDNKEMIHSSALGNEFTIHSSLNLEDLHRGDYYVVLAHSDKEYWFSVKK